MSKARLSLSQSLARYTSQIQLELVSLESDETVSMERKQILFEWISRKGKASTYSQQWNDRLEWDTHLGRHGRGLTCYSNSDSGDKTKAQSTSIHSSHGP